MRARMSMIVRVVAVLTIVMMLGPGRAQVDFKLYASTDGRFKVQFPGPVTTDVVEVPSGKDKLKITTDSVELRGGTAFLVTYVDAPPEVANAAAGPRIDKVRDANKGERGKVLQEKELTIGMEKYPARDVLIQTQDGYLRNRIVIAGPRLYQVMIRGARDVVTSASADMFLASFEVTK
jgi:hypothetical protein